MSPHEHETLRKRHVQSLLPSVWEKQPGYRLPPQGQNDLCERTVPKLLLQSVQQEEKEQEMNSSTLMLYNALPEYIHFKLIIL